MWNSRDPSLTAGQGANTKRPRHEPSEAKNGTSEIQTTNAYPKWSYKKYANEVATRVKRQAGRVSGATTRQRRQREGPAATESVTATRRHSDYEIQGKDSLRPHEECREMLSRRHTWNDFTSVFGKIIGSYRIPLRLRPEDRENPSIGRWLREGREVSSEDKLVQRARDLERPIGNYKLRI